MKKILTFVLAALMVIACFSFTACGNENNETKDTSDTKGTDAVESDSKEESKEDGEIPADAKVAMVTDYGDITDESFNQTTYEACKAFCEAKGIDFKYYKPAGDNTADRVSSIETAIADGYNVIVMPGYAFGGAIVEAAPLYKDVKFIALDVAKGDLLEAGVAAKGETYDYNPDNWNLEDYVDMENVYCAIYQEELCGYMAGYAAVKLGYTKLGFLGGMAVPAVVRYGHGFVQGVDDAAADMDAEIEVNYVYGGQFQGDADITAVMDTWYQGGTEIVFACGGGIYTSAGEAAEKTGGKIIGVDVDQKAIIDGKYGEGITVTSAMKGLYPATYDALADITVNGKWADYAGKIVTLGLISGEDATLNYVQIPYESTQWEDGKFTKDDYMTLVRGMLDGSIEVSADTSAMPEVANITVNDQGKIK